MSVRKLPSGKWLCECYPNGREGKRVRKQFSTKGEAIAFEVFSMEQAKSRPWLADKDDKRKLSELITLWDRLHGCSLSDRSGRIAKLNIICGGLGDPIASQITSRDWAHYRDRRLRGEVDNGYNVRLETRKVSTGTVNIEQAYLRAVFNELKRLGEWSYPNPLESIREFETAEREMSWLTDREIARLLAACELHGNPELTLIVRLCLSTGARWNEAAHLKASQLSPTKVTYINTKGKKNRTVPLAKELYDDLVNWENKPFAPCYKQFYRVARLAGLNLPKGQMTHVLRHSFASHFMMGGGNIVVLQRILGHSDIRITMRYAHFAPDHLEDAIRLNPLTRLNGGKMAAEVAKG